MRTSKDFVKAMERLIAQVENGDLDVGRARVIVQEHRTMEKLLALEIEHAKATGRLRQGSDELPGFNFGSKD